MAITNYKTKQLKLNTDLNGFKEGQIIKVKTTGGIIEDPYWRRRLKDSAIDNCVEVVTKRKKEIKS